MQSRIFRYLQAALLLVKGSGSNSGSHPLCSTQAMHELRYSDLRSKPHCWSEQTRVGKADDERKALQVRQPSKVTLGKRQAYGQRE